MKITIRTKPAAQAELQLVEFYATRFCQVKAPELHFFRNPMLKLFNATTDD
jgi:hypothetical protein